MRPSKSLNHTQKCFANQGWLSLDQDTLLCFVKTVSYTGVGLGDAFGSRRYDNTRANLEILPPYPELLRIKSGDPWIKTRDEDLEQGLDH